MADKEVLRVDWYDVYRYGMSFKFKWVRQDDGKIRIYILSQPDYRPGQETDGHATHRYGLGSGKPYICYDPMPRNMRDANKIAEEWAKRTAFYIKNGNWKNRGE